MQPDKKLVGCASRFIEGKGLREMVEAAAQVVSRYPEVAFVLAGSHDGDAPGIVADLQSRVRALHLENHVFIVDWWDDTPDLFASLDVFVHCPTTFLEGMGLANLEAMAMAKPTVVSNNGGLPEAVVDGVTGFVVPPGDVRQMAEAVLRLLNDEELARRYGLNGRRRVVREFDIAKNVKQYEELFHEYALRLAS